MDYGMRPPSLRLAGCIPLAARLHSEMREWVIEGCRCVDSREGRVVWGSLTYEAHC